MRLPHTIGFPRMRQEPGERRVFLPEFVQFVAGLGVDVYVEEGYGSRSGYTFEHYKRASPRVYLCDRAEAFRQDVVLILRSPKSDEFPLIRRGATLVSMLHYPTSPERVARMCDLGIHGI